MLSKKRQPPVGAALWWQYITSHHTNSNQTTLNHIQAHQFTAHKHHWFVALHKLGVHTHIYIYTYYITLHYTALLYTTLRYATPHYITLHYFTYTHTHAERAHIHTQHTCMLSCLPPFLLASLLACLLACLPGLPCLLTVL